MKSLLFIFILIINGVNSFSQTYISFVGGIDFSKITNVDSTSIQETNLKLLEDGFSIESPVVGLRIKKVITENILLSIGTEFTHKKIKAVNVSGIVSPKAISFNYIRSNIAVQYSVTNLILAWLDVIISLIR